MDVIVHRTCSLFSFVAVNLKIYHGRVYNDGVRFDRTVGVAALDIGGPLTHTFDCLRVGSTSVGNLEWRVNDMIPRFPSSNEEIFLGGDDIGVRRLNLAPVQGPPAGSNDVGTYTCVDTANRDSLSILVVAGMYVLYVSTPSLPPSLPPSFPLPHPHPFLSFIFLPQVL